MYSKLVAMTLVGMLVSVFASADEEGPFADKFYEDTAAYTEHCPTEASCSGVFRNQVVYSHAGQINKLADSTRDVLKKISFAQAQIWGDTILEGDYVANGETRLDRVLALFKGTQLIGYKIQYSEKAWYTGDCDYDGNESTLETCGRGRISESSFVSTDFLTYFTDENELASFAFDSN